MARADQVAHQAAKVAKTLSENTAITNNKLDVIHTLVNSNLTAAMQSEHDSVIRELAMMLEIIELKKASGAEPSIDALSAVEATKSRLSELAAKLHDRITQQEKVELQLREQKEGA
jgi:hypothetical protein